MIEQEWLELMNGEIDGENSPELSSKLSGYLQRHPEAADLFEELKAMSADLEGMPSIPVPPDLKEAVMESLPISRENVSGTAGVGSSFSIYRLRHFRPYFYAAAAGLLVGIVLASWYWSGSDQGLSSPGLISGTMIDPQVQDDERLAGVSIDAAGVRGNAEAFRTIRGIELELTLEADEPSTVLLGYEKGGVEFRGFSSSQGDIEELSVEDSRICFLHRGSRHYRLLFEPSTSEVSFEVSISRRGETVFNSTFGSRRSTR